MLYVISKFIFSLFNSTSFESYFDVVHLFTFVHGVHVLLFWR